ncbi:hypothetical protein Tsubulata_037835, partial [Turnera subulata]
NRRLPSSPYNSPTIISFKSISLPLSSSLQISSILLCSSSLKIAEAILLHLSSSLFSFPSSLPLSPPHLHQTSLFPLHSLLPLLLTLASSPFHPCLTVTAPFLIVADGSKRCRWVSCDYGFGCG